MQSLTFERTNGNIPRKLAGEDHISGIMFYTDTLPSGFSETERIKAVSQIETAEKLRITADAEEWIIRLMHYQLSEIFRLNPGISLYVGIFPKAEGANTYADVKKMQNFAGGRLRQIGVWEGDVAFSKENLTALQGVAATLEGQDMPLSILYAPKVAAVASLPTDAAGDMLILEDTLEFLADRSAAIHAEALPGEWDGECYTLTDDSHAAVQALFNVSPTEAQLSSASEP